MDHATIRRREFLRWAMGSVAVASASSWVDAAEMTGSGGTVPVRAITRGPRFHWFGYYDKLQFDPTGRYVLGMEVDFEHRSPRADDVIRIGMVDLADKAETLEGMPAQDGHCTYLPGNEWVLCDSYPDRERNQHLYLYHVATGRTAPLGGFYMAPEYQGEWRCDMHPRCSPDGRSVTIDSPHGGNGRQMYLIDISKRT